MFVLHTLFFTLTLWLGFYLIQRDLANPMLRWTGFALVVYATVLGVLAAQQSEWAWLLFAFGVAMWILDLTMAWRGVLVVGEAFWPDALRSLDGALLAALLFATPIALTMVLATGATTAMRLLLLATLTLAIAGQVFGEALQSALDRFAFRSRPQLQQRRAELRTIAAELPKFSNGLDLAQIDATAFARLTRRALSHYGDLPRLATNPLTHLPVITQRLNARGAADNTLERARELQRLLAAAIQRLKPPGEEEFSTGEPWRHYNALYFPYVVGLKPYSRRANSFGPHDLDPASSQALQWLRTQIPERTLYNWQNAAAGLIAQYLMESQ